MSIEKARLLFSEAQAEERYDVALRLLNQAYDLALNATSSGKNDASISLGARVLVEIAATRMDPPKRRRAWMAAIHLHEKLLEDNKSTPEMIGQYADIVVDASQDSYAELYDEIVRGRLAKAKRCLQKLTKPDCQLPAQQHAYLLTRLSAVRRAQAMTQLTFAERRRVFLDALKIATRALEIQPGTAQLELANCHWALSRQAESDEQYASDLRKTELAFRSAYDSEDHELAGYSLSRFYRLTHQASHACDEFANLIGRAHHRRRLLRESYIFAESVQHLWYTGYPEAHVGPLTAVFTRMFR